jgi:hypothetical protein
MSRSETQPSTPSSNGASRIEPALVAGAVAVLLLLVGHVSWRRS